MLTKRLRQALAERDMNWQYCAELADIPLETMRNLYYGKVKDPKVSTLLSIAQVLHTSVNWIMGENVCSEEENQLLNNYRQCGAHGKNVLQQVAKYEAMIAQEERQTSVKHRIPCMIPDNKVCDGSHYNVVETKFIDTNHQEAFMALHVPNNLWVPRYCKNDIVLLKNCFPMHTEEALFIYQGKIYYRKYIENEDHHILRCINGRYPDLIFKRMDEQDLLCIGTAVGIVRA